MSRSHDEKDEDQVQLPRRNFLRIGGLGVAALAAGAAAYAKDAPETATPGQAGQAPPAQAQTPPAQGQPAQTAQPPRSSPYKRNFDPVPASEPSMNFAAFTDTHVGQQ